MTRILVAGTGMIGRRHLAHVESHPDLELAGIVDPDPGRRAHPSAPGFATLEDVDADAGGIVIATPTETHAPLAVAAMRAGLHVLVEKPLADTLEAARSIADASRETGMRVLVGHHRRHHVRVEALKEMLDSGRLGQPLGVSLLWFMRKPDAYFDAEWRAGPNGGPVRQNLVHDVDLLRYLFGEVVEVAGLGGNPIRAASRTEHGGAVLAFDSGVIATIAFADTTATPWGFEAGIGESPSIPMSGLDCMRVACTNGGVEFPGLRIWEGAASWNEPHVEAQFLFPCKPGADAWDGAEAPLKRQLEHFARVIAGESPPLVDAEDGLKTLEATLRIEAATLPRPRRS